jgi:hypothetical protein
MRANDQVYDGNKHDVPPWALNEIRRRIKRQVWLLSCWKPNIGYEWGLSEQEGWCEWQKRRELLKAFHDLVSDQDLEEIHYVQPQLGEFEYRFIFEELEIRYIDDATRMQMVEQGRRLQDLPQIIAQIEEQIVEELEAKRASEDLSVLDLICKAEELFRSGLVRLLGRDSGLGPSVFPKLGQRKQMGRLNLHKTFCLWLGLFRKQSGRLTGLWQMYIDVKDDTIQALINVPDPPIPLTEEISIEFHPQGRQSENQRYIREILEEVERDSAKLSGKPLILTEEHTSKIIAWVVETRLPPRPKGRNLSRVELVQDLRLGRSKAANNVNQDYNRGQSILIEEFVGRVDREIDCYRGGENE